MKILLAVPPGAEQVKPASTAVRIVLDNEREVIVTTASDAAARVHASGARTDRLRSGADLDLSALERLFTEDEHPDAEDEPAQEPTLTTNTLNETTS